MVSSVGVCRTVMAEVVGKVELRLVWCLRVRRRTKESLENEIRGTSTSYHQVCGCGWGGEGGGGGGGGDHSFFDFFSFPLLK